jgi:hypothetical protein
LREQAVAQWRLRSGKATEVPTAPL